MQHRAFGLILSLAFLIVACSGPPIVVRKPEPRPLVRGIPADSSTEWVERQLAQPGSTLTLSRALQLALLANPELKAFSLEIRAREARALQASLLPNPEVEVEVENVGGRGPTRGTRAAESTLFLSELIELGGKRHKRSEAARLEGELAAWDYEVRKLELFTRVVQTYVDVLAAQERVDLQQMLLGLGGKFLETIRRRVEAGRTSPAEAYRASVDLEFIQVELEKARQELKSARKRLASLWGAKEPRFQRVEGNLEELKPVPPFSVLEDLLAENPEIARWAVERAYRTATLELEKARRIPDPSVGLGYRRLNEEADQAFVLGLSVPLPLFDRNQGAIKEAQVRRDQVEWFEKATRVALERQLTESYNSLVAASREVSVLKERVLPNAREAYRVIRDGYKMGKFGYLEVLDAQRTLFEVRSRYLEALARYHKLVADLERLVGRDLLEIADKK